MPSSVHNLIQQVSVLPDAHGQSFSVRVAILISNALRMSQLLRAGIWRAARHGRRRRRSAYPTPHPPGQRGRRHGWLYLYMPTAAFRFVPLASADACDRFAAEGACALPLAKGDLVDERVGVVVAIGQQHADAEGNEVCALP